MTSKLTCRSGGRLAVLAIGAALGTAAWTPSTLATDIKFTLDWKFEGPAAPFLVAIDKGHFKAEGLNVTIDTGNGSRDTITRIASGTYQMGFGDINALIEFLDD